MDEAQFVNSLDRETYLSHVEASDIFREDFILNEHGHQISSRQELHEHVQERAVLECRVKLDNPRTVGLGKNITLRTDVSKLVFLELWGTLDAFNLTICARHTISDLTKDLSA